MIPPRLASWLVRRALPLDRQSESIRGDLLEEYRRRGGSDLWYWRETLSLVAFGHRYKAMLTVDAVVRELRYFHQAFRALRRTRASP